MAALFRGPGHPAPCVAGASGAQPPHALWERSRSYFCHNVVICKLYQRADITGLKRSYSRKANLFGMTMVISAMTCCVNTTENMTGSVGHINYDLHQYDRKYDLLRGSYQL